MRFLFVGLILLYQQTLSRLLPPSCRFYPSCSDYAIQAVQQAGFIGGLFKTLRRLLRCHPFSPGGYDPVKEPRENSLYKSEVDKPTGC